MRFAFTGCIQVQEEPPCLGLFRYTSKKHNFEEPASMISTPDKRASRGQIDHSNDGIGSTHWNDGAWYL
jgi:hypothetical protein